MRKIVAALAAACMLVSVAAVAQEPAAGAAELAALQKAARADKRGLVAEKLALTPAEATKFWPAYDGCQRDLAQVTRRRTVAIEGLVGRDGPLTDAYARKVVDELVAIEDAEMRALRKCAQAMLRALPPRKAARYLQLENKLRTAQDYEIAVAFPLGQ
ncbi:MAG: hypothetical protein IT516_11515 [Burkholderiales bacterium]|nr:hypothetical protein [Burkholderiales bacterium]